MAKVTIVVEDDDLDQVLDGLEVLIEQWEATAEYLTTGEVREDVCIRESHSAHEAESIAAQYARITSVLREQLPDAMTP